MIVARELVAGQVSCVCRHLIHMRRKSILEILELQNENAFAAENDDVWSSPALSRQFVFEGNPPIADIRVSDSQQAQLISQDTMTIQPGGAVTLRGHLAHARQNMIFKILNPYRAVAG